MSEHNYFALTVAAQMEKDPSVFEFDIKKFEENAAKMRAARDAANPPKPEPAKFELDNLKKQLWNLENYAKACATKVDNEEANVKHFEAVVAEHCKAKKNADSAGQWGEARKQENLITRAEVDLQECREQLVKLQGYSVNAARGLRTWQQEQGARLAELQKEIA